MRIYLSLSICISIHMYMYVYMYIYIEIECYVSIRRIFRDLMRRPKWYRVAKTHMIPYLYMSFSAKEPYI